MAKPNGLIYSGIVYVYAQHIHNGVGLAVYSNILSGLTGLHIAFIVLAMTANVRLIFPLKKKSLR